ncbi:hypothetical protein [Streptomyces sp. 900105755]
MHGPARLLTAGGRRYLASHRPWTDVITEALERLRMPPNPD